MYSEMYIKSINKLVVSGVKTSCNLIFKKCVTKIKFYFILKLTTF